MTFQATSGRGRAAALAASLLAVFMGGCGTSVRTAAAVYQNEKFGSEDTFSQSFDTDMATACKAARLALLSQGYVVDKAAAEIVTGNKSFQPGGDVHVRINFTITCAAKPGDAGRSTVFVNAVQDRYTLKKSTSSASVGLPLASLSIPLSQSDESLVRVGSETIPTGSFYDRFFSLVQRFASDLGCDGNATGRCAEAGATVQ